ncbi:hypothetical protein ACG2OD_36280 [Streptomyces sp. PDY-4]|uniref:hypothetical protein n=1 Tax=Streptomyces TaxID=1883 RepID=UPI0013CE84C3|nr:hypothetical protein [Streptomyces fungicidicus]
MQTSVLGSQARLPLKAGHAALCAVSSAASLDGLGPELLSCLVVLGLGPPKQRSLPLLRHVRFRQHSFVLVDRSGLPADFPEPRVHLLQLSDGLLTDPKECFPVRLDRSTLVAAECRPPETARRGQLMFKTLDTGLCAVQSSGVVRDRAVQCSDFADGRGPFGNVLMTALESERTSRTQRLRSCLMWQARRGIRRGASLRQPSEASP